MSGKITIGAFSIGNLKDIPVRVLELIENVDIVAVEWKNAFEYYFDAINKKPKLLVECNGLADNYEELTNELISEVKNGKTLLYLVDGGTPCISDPGNLLGIMARQNNLNIEAIPGPSIVPTVLSMCGIDSHRFVFEPEVPEFQNDRIDVFNIHKDRPHTMVFIANRNSEPSRYSDGLMNENFLIDTLSDMVKVFGENRMASLCFNVTMEDEIIIRKSLKNCLRWARNNKNTKFLTIVVEGKK